MTNRAADSGQGSPDWEILPDKMAYPEGAEHHAPSPTIFVAGGNVITGSAGENVALKSFGGSQQGYGNSYRAYLSCPCDCQRTF
jgi:hypothetical protein